MDQDNDLNIFTTENRNQLGITNAQRPNKPLRNHQVSLNLTKREHDQAQKIAGMVPLATFLRHHTLETLGIKQDP